jgi:hypothetical protein
MFINRFYDEFLDFPFENTDFMDAMAMAEAYHEDYRNLMNRKSRDVAVPDVKIIYRNIDGKRIMEKVSSNNNQNDGTLDLSHLFRPQKKS